MNYLTYIIKSTILYLEFTLKQNFWIVNRRDLSKHESCKYFAAATAGY